MSPTNFFLDFDSLFQINPAERFGTEDLESFDEEFAALLNSFVNNNPLPSATPMVKENLPEKTSEQNGETFAEFPQIPIGFEPTIDNGKTSQEFPTINHILQPTNLFRAEENGLPDCDVKPIQTELPEMIEVESETLPFNSTQIKFENPPKAAETFNHTAQSVKANSEVELTPENKTSESQNKLEPSALEQSKQAETSVQTLFHAGEFDTKKINQSKKILVVDKDVKIERHHNTSKQFEFEKKQFLPILQADEVIAEAKPKASANFQTVLENFSENSNPAPALKKIKLESVSTAFYEQPTTQENFVNELSGAESQPVNFEQFVENVPEQVIEPMIVLAKETGKPDAPRTVKIKLNPEELGTVEISLEGNASGKLSAELVTETKTAEAFLNQNINELQKVLEHSGWQIETLTISCGDTNSGQSEKQSQQAENRPNFDNSSFTPESETVSSEIDDRLLSVRA